MLSDRCFERYAKRDELRPILERDGERWFDAVEREELGRFRDAGRRETWMLGRLLSKQLILDQFPDVASDPADVEISSTETARQTGRPLVNVNGQFRPWCLSISHSDRGILVALSANSGLRVGVDLAAISETKPGFLETWFTRREQASLESHGAERVATYWAVKEAVYKAYNTGESFVPRRIEVCPRENDESAFTSIYDGIDLSSVCHVETRMVNGEVAAVASLRYPLPPNLLQHSRRTNSESLEV